MFGVRLERATFDVFHDDVAALVVGHRVVDGADMRMRQLAGERGLGQEKLAKPLAVLFVAEDVPLDDLDRDLAIGKRIHAQIDGTGRAFAQFAQDLIFADLFQHFWRRGGVLVRNGLSCHSLCCKSIC